ncbi:MAG TPA: hypothetical protein VKV39_13230 [Candidatus Sulfotelmatobacter sp.]|nr:hypothetical protein [Candidatus Sulfotelmatobacter sp.]
MRKQVAPTFLALAILAAILSFGPSARAADSAAPSYPDWAAAVVPAYPHARPWSSPIAARVQSKMYGLVTTDLMPTVVAWYKARVHGAWSESEGGNNWSVKSGGVRIQISANYYDDSGAEKPGTRIALTRYP